jgi:LPPG:FO 2-phospho-L-lactate transferase
VILALAGGTGGSKIVDGLAQVVGQSDLSVIVNTGDDGDFFGLRVCPDLDINMYALAGVVDERGWGFAGDTFRCLEGLATYGHETWFGLGDRDLATHLHRTLRLADGLVLSEVTAELCERLGVGARLLPMSDDPVRTRITTESGELSFQEYLVRDGASEDIARIEMRGVASAEPAPGVIRAIDAAERIVICPSSPIVSIGTILAVPGVRTAMAERRDDVVAISPIVLGAPVEGPAARFLAGAGYRECTAVQMARLYADVAGTFVIDDQDAPDAETIEALGVAPHTTDIVMCEPEDRPRVANFALGAVSR